MKAGTFALSLSRKYTSSIINENSILELNILSKDILKDDDNRIRIDGHTDNINSDKYNLKLSQSRANSVKVYLNKLGIDSERMIINAYGELKPVSSNDTLSGQSMNRRVEVVIINNK
ncbi:MAG: OmpA family protein [Campylobacteraceae bacterium]|nr:OmpA family protein [Campylobacteraceae bacterium]